MGIKDRRLREQQQVRQSILQAVRDIAVQEGWQAVTVRKIADRIEYSPPTIYEYFASKEAIIDALRLEGFRWLLDDLKAACAIAATPEEQFLALALAYWDFAWKMPEVYQAMHGLDGVPCDPELKSPEGDEAFTLSCQVLEQLGQQRGQPVTDPAGAVDIVRAMLHGMISLSMANRINADRTRHADLIRRAVQDLMRAWTGDPSSIQT